MVASIVIEGLHMLVDCRPTRRRLPGAIDLLSTDPCSAQAASGRGRTWRRARVVSSGRESVSVHILILSLLCVFLIGVFLGRLVAIGDGGNAGGGDLL